MTETLLGLCKVCDLPDFSHPELRSRIREIFESDRRYFGEEEFPRGREYRKYWEVAMTACAFDRLGVLRPEAEILGVGAGHEATVYWLTRRVGRVIATDLYETEDSWSGSDSGDEMLTDPGRYWDSDWNPDRLTVRHMDGSALEFADESFDGVFSSSSIEHFGEFEDVRRSIEEIYRVLRPGGVAALSTEFRLEGPTAGWPGVLMFDEAQLRELLLDGIWWDPASPLDTTISREALGAPVELQEALAEQQEGARGWSRYPHVVLREGPYLWTSVHLALVKSGDSTAAWRARGRELSRAAIRRRKLHKKADDARAKLGAMTRRRG
jgi:SAM-dependent methyltransferase